MATTGSVSSQEQAEVFDLIIHGGDVLDGECETPFRADVGIRGDRVAAVRDLSAAHAGRTIDAAGKRVAPGFIDIHTHSDISVLYQRPMLSMISQGVTTQVVGNCSLSLGLARDEDVFAFERRWLETHGARIVWRDMGGHLRVVSNEGVATNYITLAGHGTIRKRVMGMADRPADRREIEMMKRELVMALEQGAWGLSTGLEYTPSGFANLQELIGLSAVMRRFGGIYATHLRNEGDKLIEAVAEALTVGESARVAVQISHHKAEHRQNWGKVRQTIEIIDEARRKGLDVWMDQYPYTAYMTSLAVQLLPMSLLAGTTEDLLRKLTDPQDRRRVVDEILSAHPDWGDAGDSGPWSMIRLATVRHRKELQGRSLAEIAFERRVRPLDAALDLIVEEGGFVSALHDAISEEDVRFVLRHPTTLVGSDAVATAPEGSTGVDRVHPRCYGTFPRVLGLYARDAGVLSEAEALRKMTSLPADRLGIKDRGRIRVGSYADVVVYDPGRIRDTATYGDPHRFSEGVETVLVNGQVVWDGGGWTGALPGRVLKRDDWR